LKLDRSTPATRPATGERHARRRRPTPIEDQSEDLEDQLEEGLEDSFPASDPPSVARRHRKPSSGQTQPNDEG
jgi:hypothetical protein